MNWDDLRYFLALHKARTVSAAGIALGVKHTTVARRIKALEQALGTRLFDRLADGYALTQAGENLIPHARIVEEQAQAVDREIFGLDAQLQGELVLTAANDVLSRLVVPHLGLFRRAYPGINIQLASSAGLVDLAARHADIALRMTAKPPEYLIGKKILPLSHGLYASEKYLRNNQNSPTKPNDVILWSSERDKPQWVKQHFPSSKVAIRSSEVGTLLDCARYHMGIARLPCYIGDSATDLLRLDLPLSPSDWGVWVLSHVDLKATARVRVCKEFLIDIIQQQQTLISGETSRYFVA